MLNVFLKPKENKTGLELPDILMTMPSDALVLDNGERVIGYSIYFRAKIRSTFGMIPLMNSSSETTENGWFGITTTGRTVFFYHSYNEGGGKFRSVNINRINSYECITKGDPEKFYKSVNECWEYDA